MNGKFEFTRDVPIWPNGPPAINFENRRKSFEKNRKRKKDYEYELEVLHKVSIENESSKTTENDDVKIEMNIQ